MAKSHSDIPNGSAPWETRRNPSGKNFFKRALPWLGGLLLLLLVGWGLWPKPVIIETGVVARGPLTVRVSEEGKTRVRNRYVVAAPVAGRMLRVPLKAGDTVVAGETVLTEIVTALPSLLDPRARAQAEAVIAMREASRKLAIEALEASKAAEKMAASNLERIRSISRSGTLSESDRDQAEMEYSMKSAAARGSNFSLQVADFELVQARAALNRPTADAEENRVVIKSPVSGRVLKVMQESETIIAPGASILEIGDPTDIEIEAEILSRDAVAIHPGDAVEIEQWGGEDILTGRVRRIEPAAFTKISALGVEEQRVIVLCDLTKTPDSVIPLGDRYRVEVRVAIWHAGDILTVPAGALFREGNKWKTFVFRQGIANLTNIKVGHNDGRFTEVLSGLVAGDQVLLHPPDTVVDGTAVTKRAE